MKNFDVAREERAKADRSFQIGGETFTRKIGVAPESIIPWTQFVTGEAEPSELDMIALCDETVTALLEEGQEKNWQKVRDPKLKNPLTVQDITGVIMWMLGEIAGRPTGAPSDSSDGRASTGTTSKVDSSLQVVGPSES